MSAAIEVTEPGLTARRPIPAFFPPRSVAFRLVALGLATRVAFAGVAALAGAYFPYAVAGGWDRGPGFVRFLARWDSGFYMDIAQKGYGFKPESWAFDPGYPAAIALVHAVLHFTDFPTAGAIVSTVAFLAALVLLYGLTERLFSARIAWRASVALAVFPGTFYLGAVYADSLFLALALGTFLAAVDRRWLLAGVLASFAAVTRPPGIVLAGALVVAIGAAWIRGARPSWQAVASVPLSATLPLVFMGYAAASTGDAFVSYRMREVYWPNVHWHDPRTLLEFSGAPPSVTFLVALGFALLLGALVFALWDGLVKRHYEAWPVYSFTGVMAVIYLAYSDPQPILRYLLPIVPLYWAAARIVRRDEVFVALAVAATAIAAFVASVFATWGPLY
ncbi:MAG: mannosyltransferase family protein [Thermoplasmatota archaeon]